MTVKVPVSVPLRIAIFDYRITSSNPVGSCHLLAISHLAHEHNFTVFATEFSNPSSDRIAFVRIPAPRRPLVLLFITYHLLAPLFYFVYRLRHGSFDLIQIVESNLTFGDVSYVHFCHRAFLSLRWKQLGAKKTIRTFMRWLDHRLHALMEPLIFKRMNYIVVPSQGLKLELEKECLVPEGKIHVIPNPIDTRRMTTPDGFDRHRFRRDLGVGSDDFLLVFVALGHFERKGLPLLLETLGTTSDPTTKLVVVGGDDSLVSKYQRVALRFGLQKTVVFAGNTTDVRPFLWASDVFVLPSAYEGFPLVALEAAAAGLPILATAVHGLDELVQTGVNGYLIEPCVSDLASGIKTLKSMSESTRREMGRAARRSVAPYHPEDRFCRSWADFYEGSQTV